MAYEIESWTRSPGSKGEERHRAWRIRNLEHGREILALALKDRGLSRVTLARTGSECIWDLWRHTDRDQELDASMRSLTNLKGLVDLPTLDIGPGVTQAQLEQAVENLVTRPGEL